MLSGTGEESNPAKDEAPHGRVVAGDQVLQEKEVHVSPEIAE